MEEADLVLSIMVPSQATALSQEVERAIRTIGAKIYYADCNAISPQTTLDIEEIISGGGGCFIDASIIGGPPKGDYRPRFYVSGEHAAVMSELDGMGIIVKQLGDEVGRASGIKMCYAGLTKGTSALQVAVLSLAESWDFPRSWPESLSPVSLTPSVRCRGVSPDCQPGQGVGSARWRR